jgi:hypothetical protein
MVAVDQAANIGANFRVNAVNTNSPLTSSARKRSHTSQRLPQRTLRGHLRPDLVSPRDRKLSRPARRFHIRTQSGGRAADPQKMDQVGRRISAGRRRQAAPSTKTSHVIAGRSNRSVRCSMLVRRSLMNTLTSTRKKTSRELADMVASGIGICGVAVVVHRIRLIGWYPTSLHDGAGTSNRCRAASRPARKGRERFALADYRGYFLA